MAASPDLLIVDFVARHVRRLLSFVRSHVRIEARTTKRTQRKGTHVLEDELDVARRAMDVDPTDGMSMQNMWNDRKRRRSEDERGGCEKTNVHVQHPVLRHQATRDACRPPRRSSTVRCAARAETRAACLVRVFHPVHRRVLRSTPTWIRPRPRCVLHDRPRATKAPRSSLRTNTRTRCCLRSPREPAFRLPCPKTEAARCTSPFPRLMQGWNSRTFGTCRIQKLCRPAVLRRLRRPCPQPIPSHAHVRRRSASWRTSTKAGRIGLPSDAFLRWCPPSQRTRWRRWRRARAASRRRDSWCTDGVEGLEISISSHPKISIPLPRGPAPSRSRSSEISIGWAEIAIERGGKNTEIWVQASRTCDRHDDGDPIGVGDGGFGGRHVRFGDRRSFRGAS